MQQGYRQSSVRAVTNTTLDYNGDWNALFDGASIPAGDFDGRLLQWLNAQLGVTYTNLPEAMHAFAVSQGAFNWSSMGTFNAGTPAAPVNTGLPLISGIKTRGQTLSTTNGTWTGSPTGYTYQWKRDGTDIGSATASTYLLAAGDVGKVITVVVTATNATGSTPATSAGTSAIAALLSISGTPVTTGTQGTAYAGFSVAGAGGHTAYVYSVHAGTLPAGITLNSSTGAVAGTPTGVENQTGIVIRVTDADGLTADLASFGINVSAASGFLPTDLGATLVQWLDGADAATIIQSGGAISAWTDKSGAGNSAAQSDGTYKPTVASAALNGLEAVAFADHVFAGAPGTGCLFMTHNSILSSDYSCFYVLKTTEGGVAHEAAQFMHSSDLTGSGISIFAEVAALSAGFGTGATTTGGNLLSDENPMPVGVWRIQEHFPTKLYKNGIEVTYGSTTDAHGGGLTTIGSWGGAAHGNFFTGVIAEIIVCDTVLSDADRARVEGYLTTKWGL